LVTGFAKVAFDRGARTEVVNRDRRLAVTVLTSPNHTISFADVRHGGLGRGVPVAEGQLARGDRTAAGKSMDAAIAAAAQTGLRDELAFMAVNDYGLFTSTLVRLGRQKQAVELLTPFVEMALDKAGRVDAAKLAVWLAEAGDLADARRLVARVDTLPADRDPAPRAGSIATPAWTRSARDRILIAVACRQAFDRQLNDARKTLEACEVPADKDDGETVRLLAENLARAGDLEDCRKLFAGAATPAQRSAVCTGTAFGLTASKDRTTKRQPAFPALNDTDLI
jgi:hypothetical protein